MSKITVKSKNSSDCVVIPAYEPSEELISLVSALHDKGFSILVVDDGSSRTYQHVWDSLSDISTVLHHKTNRGKGAALKTAFNYISKLNYAEETIRTIVTADADGQHLPKDIERVMDAVHHHPSGLILGSRAFERDVPARSKFGNTVTRFVFSLVSRTKVSDTQTGLRGFDAGLLTFMKEVPGDRYEYEMNMLLTASKENIPMIEVPIETVYLDEKNSCSHFNTVKDSVKIYGTILKFAGSSFISFLLDYSLFTLFVLLCHNIPGGIMLSNVSARIISAAANYSLNEKIVFQSQEKSSKTLPKYILLAVFILCANSLILSFYLSVFNLPAYIAKVLTEITLFVISMSIQTLFIFNKKPLHKKSGETA